MIGKQRLEALAGILGRGRMIWGRDIRRCASNAFASSISDGLTRSAERDLERGRERGRDFRRGFGCGREDVSEFDSDWGSVSNELLLAVRFLKLALRRFGMGGEFSIFTSTSA